jgi:hypothetical protein
MCVRLCELETYGCVLVVILSVFYFLRMLYARLKIFDECYFSLVF